VKSAEAGVPLSAIEPGTVVKISARSGFPVFNADRKIIGVVSIGFQGDNSRFLCRLKKNTALKHRFFIRAGR
jgi:sensor histidine kinase regulating citrate/malate metabolism